jgi:hypothetical protein
MELRLTGTQPLIMHNVQAADPYNPFARAMKELTSKRKKTDSDLGEIDRLKFLSGLYYEPATGPFLPAPNVFRALIEAGTITKSGKKIERGVTFLSRLAPLEYSGPRTPEELWGNGDTPFVDRRIVVVNRSRIPGVRPIFPEWAASFEIEIDPDIIDRDEFEAITVRAGRVGVGDFRRFYGKFAVKLAG